MQMNIIYSNRLPGNKVKVMLEDQGKLEVRTYPGPMAPSGDNTTRINYSRYNNRFRFGDFAEGRILSNKIYYNSCNPKFRSLSTSVLNLAEGSRFRDG